MSDRLREAAKNLVAVCDDLEAKSALRTGGSRMSGYWLQRDRIDPIRAALTDTADAPPEVTEEMVVLLHRWLKVWQLYGGMTNYYAGGLVKDTKAALAAAHEEGK